MECVFAFGQNISVDALLAAAVYLFLSLPQTLFLLPTLSALLVGLTEVAFPQDTDARQAATVQPMGEPSTRLPSRQLSSWQPSRQASTRQHSLRQLSIRLHLIQHSLRQLTTDSGPQALTIFLGLNFAQYIILLDVLAVGLVIVKFIVAGSVEQAIDSRLLFQEGFGHVVGGASILVSYLFLLSMGFYLNAAFFLSNVMAIPRLHIFVVMVDLLATIVFLGIFYPYLVVLLYLLAVSFVAVGALFCVACILRGIVTIFKAICPARCGAGHWARRILSVLFYFSFLFATSVLGLAFVHQSTPSIGPQLCVHPRMFETPTGIVGVLFWVSSAIAILAPLIRMLVKKMRSHYTRFDDDIEMGPLERDEDGGTPVNRRGKSPTVADQIMLREHWKPHSDTISQYLVKCYDLKELDVAMRRLVLDVENDLKYGEWGLAYIIEEPFFSELAVFCNMGFRWRRDKVSSPWTAQKREEFNLLCNISRTFSKLLLLVANSSYATDYFTECRWVISYLIAQSGMWKTSFTTLKGAALDAKKADSQALLAMTSRLPPDVYRIYQKELPVPKRFTPTDHKRELWVQQEKLITLYSTRTNLAISGDEDWIIAKWVLKIWQEESRYEPVPHHLDLLATLSKDHPKVLRWLASVGWSFEEPQQPQPKVTPPLVLGAFLKELDSVKFAEVEQRRLGDELCTQEEERMEVQTWLCEKFSNQGDFLFTQKGFDSWNAILYLKASDVDPSFGTPSPPPPPPPPPSPKSPLDQRQSSYKGDQSQQQSYSEYQLDDEVSAHQRKCGCRLEVRAWTRYGIVEEAKTRQHTTSRSILDSNEKWEYAVITTKIIQGLYQLLKPAKIAPIDPVNELDTLAYIKQSETTLIFMCPRILCKPNQSTPYGDYFLTALENPDRVVPVFHSRSSLFIPDEHLIHKDKVDALERSSRRIDAAEEDLSPIASTLRPNRPIDYRIKIWLGRLNLVAYHDILAQKGFDTMEIMATLQEADETTLFAATIPPGHFRQIRGDVLLRARWKDVQDQMPPPSSPSS